MSDLDADRSKGDGGEEISRELVVACGDATQVFEPVEEAFDEIALSIAFAIDPPQHPNIALAGNMGGGPDSGEEFDNRAGAVAAISDRFARRPQAGDQARRGRFVGRLAGRQQQANRQADGLTTAWILVLNPPRERPMA